MCTKRLKRPHTNTARMCCKQTKQTHSRRIRAHVLCSCEFLRVAGQRGREPLAASWGRGRASNQIRHLFLKNTVNLRFSALLCWGLGKSPPVNTPHPQEGCRGRPPTYLRPAGLPWRQAEVICQPPLFGLVRFFGPLEPCESDTPANMYMTPSAGRGGH